MQPLHASHKLSKKKSYTQPLKGGKKTLRKKLGEKRVPLFAAAEGGERVFPLETHRRKEVNRISFCNKKSSTSYNRAREKRPESREGKSL